jgi:drug/metabolite transporter (DMT)-like permease
MGPLIFVAYAAASLALWYGLQHYLVRAEIVTLGPILRYTLVTLPILFVSQVLSYLAYTSGYRAFGDRIWLTQMGWWTISFVVSGISGYIALRELPTRGTLAGLGLMLLGIYVARRF